MREDPPRILGLDDFPAAQGPEVLDDEKSLPNGVGLRRTHFWRRISAGQIECGETAEITLTRKIGVTESVLNEVSAGLEIPLGTLKATLGGKVSISASTSDEVTTQYKKTLTSKDCQGIRYAEWQLVDQITLVAPKRRWFGLMKPLRISHVLDNPLNEFASDRFIYPSPHCCRDDFENKLNQGYDTLRAIRFPNLKILAMSRIETDGTLSFASVPGRWRPGESIPPEVFAGCFASMWDPAPLESGTIDIESYGPARQLYDVSRDLTHRVTHDCPSIVEMLAQIDSIREDGNAAANAAHFGSEQCSQCQEILGFLYHLNRNERLDWAASDPIVLRLAAPLFSDANASEDRENRRELARAGVRLRLSENDGRVAIHLLGWNPLLAERQVEVVVFGSNFDRSRFPLKRDRDGLMAGVGNFRLSAKKWATPGERRLVVIRFIEPSAVQRIIRRVGEILGVRGNSELKEMPLVPAVPLTATEVTSVGPLVAGVVRSVQGSALTIEAAVEGSLHVGQSLQVYRDDFFLGVAVVSRQIPGGALCEFQPAGPDPPIPGDLVMGPGPE